MNRFFKIFSIIFLASIVPFFSVCTKEQKTYPLNDTEWEVWSITAPDNDFILIAPTPYPVNFHKDNIFNIRLDVNSCGSTYRLEAENNIYIDPIYCTLVCCDSDFANTLIDILKDVNSYKITGEDLELFSPDRIINLRKVNNDN